MQFIKNFIFVAIVVAIFYQYINQADRDEVGAIVSEGDVDIYSLRVGDCFNNTEEFTNTLDSEEELTGELPGIPCGDPHDNEVYAVFDVTIPTFPGDEAISKVAYDECFARFEPFVGKNYEDSVFDFTYLYPTEDSWASFNDREVVCSLNNYEGNKITGNMKNVGI